MAALSGPAEAVPEMVELLRRSAPWEAQTSASHIDNGSRAKPIQKPKGRSKIGS
jgi:hypothetical protein